MKAANSVLKETVEAIYRARTPGSERLHEESSEVLPMGVSGAAKYYAPYPAFLERAEGGHVWDVDGNLYVDLLMGAGPNLLGHRPPSIIDAVRRQLDQATQLLAPTRLELSLARRLQGHMPYLERIRFTNTGSEAVRTCLRAARAYSGRTGLAKLEGGFHGSDDPFLVSTGSVGGAAERPVPSPASAGVPGYVLEDVLVLPFDDVARSVELVEERADRLAAVFLEPVAFSTGGAIPVSADLARALRQVTARHGILLVFDEVVTCYRMGLGGGAAYLGVEPDLSAVGKAIGGGFPLAAMGGRAEVMDAVVGPRSAGEGRQVFQSGTYTGNPVSLAAGLAVLDVLEGEPVLERIDALAEQLRAGLRRVFRQHRIAAHVSGVGSVFQVHFAASQPCNRRDILAGDLELTRLFLLGLVGEGVLWPPIHPGVTAYAHSDEDIHRVLEAADRVAGLFVAAGAGGGGR